MECTPCEPASPPPPPPPEPVGFIDLDLDGVGAFASLCRCGRQRCSTHIQPSGEVGRVVLPPDVEPVAYTLALALRLDDHAFDGEVRLSAAVPPAAPASPCLHLPTPPTPP